MRGSSENRIDRPVRYLLKTVRVMIVNDNDKVRRLIISFIGNLANNFIECSDGTEALNAYTREGRTLPILRSELRN